MNLTVIGASTGIGQVAVGQALAAGHHVTALARNLDQLGDRPTLIKIKGCIRNYEQVKKAITGANAVIMTIGVNKNEQNNLLYVNAAVTIIEVFEELKLDIPLIVVSSFGTGSSWKYHNFLEKTYLRLFRKKEYRDKTLMEKLLASSKINWIIVRAAALTDGPLTAEYKVKTHLHKRMKIKNISRADVAHFLLSQAMHPALLHKYPALTY